WLNAPRAVRGVQDDGRRRDCAHRLALRCRWQAEAGDRQHFSIEPRGRSTRADGCGRSRRQNRAGDWTMTDRFVLHEYAASGNCYKVRLTAAIAGVRLERREYDIMKGETRTPEFLAHVNANGRIPVLQVGDRFIPESNAACYFVADGSQLIPTDRFEHADMLRWMFFEQYNHEPNIATLRFWMRSIGLDSLTDLQRLQMPGKRQA